MKNKTKLLPYYVCVCVVLFAAIVLPEQKSKGLKQHRGERYRQREKGREAERERAPESMQSDAMKYRAWEQDNVGALFAQAKRTKKNPENEKLS